MVSAVNEIESVSDANAAIFFIQARHGRLIDLRDELRMKYPDEYVRVVVGQSDANVIFVKFGLSGIDELRSEAISWMEGQEAIDSYKCCIGSCLRRPESSPRSWGMTQHLVFQRRDLPSSASGEDIATIAMKQTEPLMVLRLSGSVSSVVVYPVSDDDWSKVSDNSDWWSGQGFPNVDYVCP